MFIFGNLSLKATAIPLFWRLQFGRLRTEWSKFIENVKELGKVLETKQRMYGTVATDDLVAWCVCQSVCLSHT